MPAPNGSTGSCRRRGLAIAIWLPRVPREFVDDSYHLSLPSSLTLSLSHSACLCHCRCRPLSLCPSHSVSVFVALCLSLSNLSRFLSLSLYFPLEVCVSLPDVPYVSVSSLSMSHSTHDLCRLSFLLNVVPELSV